MSLAERLASHWATGGVVRFCHDPHGARWIVVVPGHRMLDLSDRECRVFVAGLDAARQTLHETSPA